MSNQTEGVCPNCKADSHISYSQPNYNDPEAVFFDVMCYQCGTTWDEHYSIVFFEKDNIQIPSEQ